jgi:uncharacterized protein YjiS (DUF1127 family)
MREHRHPANLVRRAVVTSEPLSEVEFMDTWHMNDRTVLCLSSENKAIIPTYIPFDNEDGELFSSGTMSWRHGRRERDHLKVLFEAVSQEAGRFVTNPSPPPPPASQPEHQGS